MQFALLPLLLASLLLLQINALTGLQVQNSCHCDLTTAFCDWGCCCDTDCSSTISAACFNAQSNSYCPDATFFSRMGTGFLNTQGCFYFNSSSDILEQVTLTNAQVTTIASQQHNFTRLASASASTRPGYQAGDVLKVGGVATFSFATSAGTCITTGGSNNMQVKFGLDMKLTCSSSSAATDLLFSSFSGKTLEQFSGDSTLTVSIPTFATGTITAADITIIVGYYGSANSRYVERVTVSSSSIAGTELKLSIRFVQPQQLLSGGSAPTFFPQLPSDFFYPVYLMN